MKLMLVGTWKDDIKLSDVGGRFMAKGDLRPSEGITFLGRWHDTAGKKVWNLVECDDETIALTWLTRWTDYFHWAVHVVTDDEGIIPILSDTVGQD